MYFTDNTIFNKSWPRRYLDTFWVSKNAKFCTPNFMILSSLCLLCVPKTQIITFIISHSSILWSCRHIKRSGCTIPETIWGNVISKWYYRILLCVCELPLKAHYLFEHAHLCFFSPPPHPKISGSSQHPPFTSCYTLVDDGSGLHLEGKNSQYHLHPSN